VVILNAGLSVMLGLVLLASSVPKLRHPKGFVLKVLEYEILQPPAARAYARLVPMLEWLAAVLFLSGTATRVAAVVASALLASFAIGVGATTARGRNLDCGCFAEGRWSRTGWRLLAADVSLLLASIAVATTSASWTAPLTWPASAVGLDPMLPRAAGLALCTAALARYVALPWRFRQQERRWRANTAGK
jgi:uncharacterized membrane protein YphA (DoxX/SURF4 family)